jgi:hypothetical protein
MTEQSDIHKFSIFNLQFPDQAGFTLCYNPASGISAALRPAELVRVRALKQKPVTLSSFLDSFIATIILPAIFQSTFSGSRTA